MNAFRELADFVRHLGRKPVARARNDDHCRPGHGGDAAASGAANGEPGIASNRMSGLGRLGRRLSPHWSDGRRTAWRRRVVALAAIGVVAAVVHSSFGLNKENPSRLSRLPGIDSTPGGARQAESEHYRQTLMDANSINADVAARSGDSYIPIPEGLPTSIIQDHPGTPGGSATEVPVKPQPDPVAAANSVPAGSGPPQPAAAVGTIASPVPIAEDRKVARNSLASINAEAMISQMGAISRGLTIGSPEGVVLIGDSGGSHGESVLVPNPAASDGTAAGRDGHGPGIQGDSIRLSAGMLLYGETVFAVSSDLPSPVVVEVNTGPLTGSRFVGSFSSAGAAGGLAVKFSRLATAEGIEVGVDAIAVDGIDGTPLIAGEVNSRFAERFGPGVVASFISGFAESASRPSTSLAEFGGSMVAATGKSSTRESVIAGFGKAADRLASDIAKGAPSGAETILRAGHPIGILVLATIELPI